MCRLWRRLRRRGNRLWPKDSIRDRSCPSACWKVTKTARCVTDVNAVVGPDASTGTSPLHDWLVCCVLASSSSSDSPSAALLLNRHRQPVCRSSLQHCSVMGGGDLCVGVNLKRRNARRRFKISALCTGGQFLAAISSAAISEAANDR